MDLQIGRLDKRVRPRARNEFLFLDQVAHQRNVDVKGAAAGSNRFVVLQEEPSQPKRIEVAADCRRAARVTGARRLFSRAD